MPHDAAKDSTARHACCHETEEAASATDHSPAKQPECPCALSLTERGLADGKTVLPKLFASDAMEAASLPSAYLPAASLPHISLPRVDENPPWHPPALYLQYCARLL